MAEAVAVAALNDLNIQLCTIIILDRVAILHIIIYKEYVKLCFMLCMYVRPHLRLMDY